MVKPFARVVTVSLAVAIGLAFVGCDDPGRRPIFGESCSGSTATCAEGQCLSGLCLSPEGDADLDGLTNAQEHRLGSSPISVDTDGDGLVDSAEAPPSMDPSWPDFDGDGALDVLESAVADRDVDCVPDQYDSDDNDPSTSISAMIPVLCSLEGVCAASPGPTVVCSDPTDPSTRRCEYAGVGSYEAQESSCDGRDNDCDGVTDKKHPDLDDDGIADCVDPDVDGDGYDNGKDNCPNLANPTQVDLDADGLGDACDTPDAPVFIGIERAMEVTPEGALRVLEGSASAAQVTGTAGLRHDLWLYRDDPECAGSTPVVVTADDEGNFSGALAANARALTTFSAKAVNSAGLQSACSAAPFAYRHVVGRSKAPSWVTPAEVASQGVARNVVLNVCAEPGVTVYLITDLASTNTACGLGLFDTTVRMSPAGAGLSMTSCPPGWDPWIYSATAFANDTTLWRAFAVDAYGLPGDCSEGRRYRHDDVGPTFDAPSVATVKAWNKTEVVFDVVATTEPFATVELHRVTPEGPWGPGATCASDLVTTVAAGADGRAVARVTVAPNAASSVAFAAHDALGNQSLCSDRVALVGPATLSLAGSGRFQAEPSLDAGTVSFHWPDGRLMKSEALADDQATATALVFEGCTGAAWWSVREEPGDTSMPAGLTAQTAYEERLSEQRQLPIDTHGIDSVELAPNDRRVMTLPDYIGKMGDQIYGPRDAVPDQFVLDIVGGPDQQWAGQILFRACANILGSQYQTFSCSGPACRVADDQGYNFGIPLACVDSIRCIAPADAPFETCDSFEYDATIAAVQLGSDRNQVGVLGPRTPWRPVRWRTGEDSGPAHAELGGEWGAANDPSDAWVGPHNIALILPDGIETIDVAQRCDPGTFITIARDLSSDTGGRFFVPLRENCPHVARSCLRQGPRGCERYSFSDSLLVLPRDSNRPYNWLERFPPADPTRAAWLEVPLSWMSDDPVVISEAPYSLNTDMEALQWPLPGGRNLELVAPVAADFAYILFRCGMGAAVEEGVPGFTTDMCWDSRRCVVPSGDGCAEWQYAAEAIAVVFAVDEVGGNTLLLSEPATVQWRDSDWKILAVFDTFAETTSAEGLADFSVSLHNDMLESVVADVSVAPNTPFGGLPPFDGELFDNLWQLVGLDAWLLAPGAMTDAAVDTRIFDLPYDRLVSVVHADNERGLYDLRHTGSVGRAIASTEPNDLVLQVSSYILPTWTVLFVDASTLGTGVDGLSYRATLRAPGHIEPGLMSMAGNISSDYKRFSDLSDDSNANYNQFRLAARVNDTRVHHFPYRPGVVSVIVSPLEEPVGFEAWHPPGLNRRDSRDRAARTPLKRLTNIVPGLVQIVAERFGGYRSILDSVGTHISELGRIWTSGGRMPPTSRQGIPKFVEGFLPLDSGLFGWSLDSSTFGY